ncbi:hypothetical protein LR48_Vigan10g233800 [Vigna angularis]|uniref:Amine oxidase domain-containing protein n=1 Tax=Phaseolus angularis TaxID=3914 RepID=A0A0L9VN28_PHAAN|nr:hypothetical protein LR48_Vigan10g233800 [Vigna angularis]
MFYYKGDYYRYFAEFKAGNKKIEVADHSFKAYQTAATNVESEFQPTHEIMNSLERVCHLAKQAFGVGYVVIDWSRNPFSYGDSSYDAIGNSGDDYDIVGRSIDNCLFFADEVTCQEHLDTVGGAMMNGLRESVRIIDTLSTKMIILLRWRD